ncbi:MAG: TrkH family potassium uptake protein [Hyphomicrobiaceae bacterium]
MIQFRPILLALGLVVCLLAVAMLLPMAVDYADGHSSGLVFAGSALVTLFIGVLMMLFAYDARPVRAGLREAFLLTTLCWTLVPAFAAIPFLGLGLPVADAFFEGVSALTTTGGTVITNLDAQPRGILLWRALLQGIGGLGIIVVAILILPYLRIGGMQLFQTESSDRSEKVLPRAYELVSSISGIFIIFLVACMIVYMVLGMTPFDAICHALSTVATGGFSTHDKSFGHFQPAALHWAAIFFMICGALPFVLYIKAMRGDTRALWHDAQVRGFLLLLITTSAVLATWLVLTRDMPFADAGRLAAFNVVSIVTTTGFSNDDYAAWGPFAVGIFFILMFVGGCSGSTSGGIKIYRLQVASLLTRSHLLHLISPHRIVTLLYNGRRLPEDVPFSVVAFLALYMATIGLFTVVLAAMGLDLVTALSSATTAVSNVGPGLGPIVGPSGTFADLPAGAKWVLSFAMLLGRLELFTVLVLFRPEFWRG